MSAGKPGKPHKSASQLRGEADLKRTLYGDPDPAKRERWSGLGFLCPIPYGQWAQGDNNFTLTQLQKAKTRWENLEKEGNWPPHLLSFEAWCGMTNYDASKDDGGPAFQRLMLMVLGHGSTIKLNDSGAWTGVDKKGLGQMDFTTCWDANRREYGPMFKTEQYTFGKPPPPHWYEGYQANGDGLGVQMQTNRSDDEWVSSGAHLSIHSRPQQQFTAEGLKGGVDEGVAQRMGLILGNYSGDSTAIVGEGAKYATKANHYGIYTKHDWIVKGLLQTGTRGSGTSSQTLGQGLVSPGVDKILGKQGHAAGQCWEATRLKDDEPCMLLQNSLAAIYGLYYYPGCNHKDLQWEVEEHVPELNKYFRIRFRCPNPSYGQPNWIRDNKSPLENNNDLPVYEPLNPKNRGFLQTFLAKEIDEYNSNPANANDQMRKRAPNEYVGGTIKEEGRGRFYVPRCSRSAPKDHPTVSPWMYLINEKDTMQVAPFWNKSVGWHELQHVVRLGFERGATLRKAEILVAGEQKDEVAFGFRMSQAFLLYPFRAPAKAEYIKRTVRDGARPVGFMTEPIRDKSKNPTGSPDVPLAKHILEWDEWWSQDNQKPEVWRAKLLSNTDPVLVNEPPRAPVNVPRSNAQGKQPVAPRAPVQRAPPDGGAGSSAPTVEPEPATVNDVDSELDEEEVRDDDTNPVGQTAANQPFADTANVSTSASAVRDTVATSTGIPGMSLAETLKECDVKYDFTDAEVRKLMGKPTDREGTGLNPRDKKILKALIACRLYDPVLEDGAARHSSSEAQCHWRTARHSPWSHAECYEPALIKYEYELMNPNKIAEFKQRYGHDANLIQDSANNIKRISDVKISWGAKKDAIMTSGLTQEGRLHRLNLARILVIYFAPEGVGYFSPDEKREGMRKGLGCCKGSARNAQQKVGVWDGRKTASWELLWGPVFTNYPERVLNRRVLHCLQKQYLCDRTITDDNELEKCLDQIPNWQTELGKVTSDMTVAQWVTTPWHLEHLPYQKQYAVFRDGECFSEGCKRCSRTFYEYAYHVYADRQSKKGTFGYPQDLWFRSDERLAPVPLHDPIFWDVTGYWKNAKSGHPNNAAEGGSVRARNDADEPEQLRTRQRETEAEVERDPDIAREYDFYTGGTMAWPMYRLYKDRLTPTDQQRTHVKSSGDMFFRRYLNLAYSTAKTNGKLEDQDQVYYRGVTEGYMHGGNHKVKFGNKDYKVSRSHKYGNVCRDCAGILDRAPGLFIRNNRWQFDGGLVQGNSEAASAATFDYWQLMFDRVARNDPNVTMDAFLMKGRTERLSRMDPAEARRWTNQFDNAAKALADSLNARHKFPDGWTRLVEQPTIHVQGSMSVQQDRKPEQIADAIKVLRALFNGANPSGLDLSNPALKDILKEAERKYIHNEAYARIDYTKQFDSDVKRTEYRNCVIRWSDNGLEWLNPPGSSPTFRFDKREARVKGTTLPENNKTLGKLTKARYANGPSQAVVYYNCLITDQYDPALLDQRIRDFRMPTDPKAYRVEVYLVTRRGVRGEADHPNSRPTQWKGDGFVCEPQGDQPWKAKEVQDDGRALVQYRAMRQSRLFITYSLHRAISSEGEGRVILERMAEALYTLFGQDRWLSEMIVFGKILRSMDVARQRGDNVSKAMWSVIDKTKKQEAMDRFYGSRNASRPRTSYVYDTYETHIDKLEVDAGCEIGPKMGHPHFHLLLTVNHFGYVQFDYFKMNTFLEIMFRGIDTHHGWGRKFYLPGNFYGDNENPYVDIRLYPQDNWREILAAYVRKNAIPSIVEVEAARRMPGTAEQRQRAQSGAYGPGF